MIIVISNPKTLDKLKRNRNLISCSYSFRSMDRRTDRHLMFQQFVLRVLNFDTSSSIESMFIHVSVRPSIWDFQIKWNVTNPKHTKSHTKPTNSGNPRIRGIVKAVVVRKISIDKLTVPSVPLQCETRRTTQNWRNEEVCSGYHQGHFWRQSWQ